MQEQRAWTHRLATQLREDGYYVVFDQFMKLDAYESVALASCVKVFVMVLTHTYGMKMSHFFPGSSYTHEYPPRGWSDGVTYDEVQIAIAASNKSGLPNFACVLREGHGRIYKYPTINMVDGQDMSFRYQQLRAVIDQLLDDPKHACLKKLPTSGRCAYCDYLFDHTKVEVCHSCKMAYPNDNASCSYCGHRNHPEGTFVWYGFLNCFQCNNGVIIPSGSDNLVIGNRGDFKLYNQSG